MCRKWHYKYRKWCHKSCDYKTNSRHMAPKSKNCTPFPYTPLQKQTWPHRFTKGHHIFSLCLCFWPYLDIFCLPVAADQYHQFDFAFCKAFLGCSCGYPKLQIQCTSYFIHAKCVLHIESALTVISVQEVDLFLFVINMRFFFISAKSLFVRKDSQNYFSIQSFISAFLFFYFWDLGQNT